MIVSFNISDCCFKSTLHRFRSDDACQSHLSTSFLCTSQESFIFWRCTSWRVNVNRRVKRKCSKMQNCNNRRILKCLKSLWARYSWVRFDSVSWSYLNKWVSSLFLLSSDLSLHTLLIFPSFFWSDLSIFLVSKLLTMTCRKALRLAHHIIFTASLSSTAKNNVFSHDYYNQRYKEMNKKHQSINLYENFTELHMNRMKDLWKEYVKCFSLSLRFIDSSTDCWIFLDTAKWWTSIFIIHLRRLLQAESTISFTECATSIQFKKLASSSFTDIKPVVKFKLLNSTQIELQCWVELREINSTQSIQWVDLNLITCLDILLIWNKY